MSSEAARPAISVRNLSKVYDLGLSGRTRSLRQIVGARLRHPVRGVPRTRDQLRALDDVSFDVEAGEVVGVIGKNGAGKSTLLKILSRITPPTSGHIDMVGSVGSLLEVGTGFHPDLTGLENVYLNGSILGMPRSEIDRRLDEIIEFSEVERFLDTPVKRYSSGMRVRLAFSVAAHLEPEVLIIDEVLSVGDTAFQAKCLERMRSIAADDGRTVLYVSHNLLTVENLCPRSMLLVDGRVAFDGDTEEAIDAYLRLIPHGGQAKGSGVFDLTGVSRSEADHDVVFTRIGLRPGGLELSDTVRMGSGLRLEIDVEGIGDVSDPVLMVTVGSSESRNLFRLSSLMKPLLVSSGRGDRERIVIDIPSVPLTPGEYDIEVSLKDKNLALLDRVLHAAKFQVVSADLFGTGYELAFHDGLFVVPWEWELRPLADAPVGSGGH